MRQKLFNVFLTCLLCLTTTAAAYAQQPVKVTASAVMLTLSLTAGRQHQ